MTYNEYRKEAKRVAATIKDVAKVAGVSIKTVSRVINDEPYVTSDTRNRVLAAIRSVGYAPNISARRLVQQKSFMLCILMYPAFYQPASALLTRIMDIGYEENYDILIQPYFPYNSYSRNKLVELINEHHIDGFVTVPPCDAEDFVADLLNTYKVPLVQINPFNRRENTPTITGGDYQGAFVMTEHLISLGHRRISFLMGPRNMRASFDRLYGYKSALDANQIKLDENLILDSEFTFDGGFTAAKILLSRADKPTAIFAGNDEAAYGALFAAQELGFSIPQQLSISGFDDINFSKQVWPGLTTIHQPADEFIETATRLLIDILKNKTEQLPPVTISSRLVVRGSTGPLLKI